MLDLPLVLWNGVPKHSVVDAAYFPQAGRLFTASAEGQICLWIIEEGVDDSVLDVVGGASKAPSASTPAAAGNPAGTATEGGTVQDPTTNDVEICRPLSSCADATST